MYGILGKATNYKSLSKKDFTIFLSLLERKYNSSPLTSCCTFTIDSDSTAFVILCQENITSDVMTFAKNYFETLNNTPNVTIELLNSPQF